MKVQKYVFHFRGAVDKVAKRYGIRPPHDSEMFVLYAIQYIPFECSQQTILRHANSVGYPISHTSIFKAVNYLLSVGLITYQDSKLALAPLGREYLSAIRRYLLNKRL
jgi:hypothetical protein